MMTFLCSFLQDRERNLCHSRHVFLRGGSSQQGLLGSPSAQTWQSAVDSLVMCSASSAHADSVFEIRRLLKRTMSLTYQVFTNSSVTWAPLDAIEQNTSCFYALAIGQLRVFRGLVKSYSYSGRCLDTQWFCALLSSISPGAGISTAKGLSWSRP